MLAELRHGVGVLARSPGFTLVAALSLALGMGATTAVFSLMNAMLFRPLPVAQPQQLVRVTALQSGNDSLSFSYPEYRYLRDHSRSFTGLVAHQPSELSLVIEGEAVPGWAEVVSGSYFTDLRIPLALGRGFSEEEDRSPGTHPVMVISHRLWRNGFAADPNVLAKRIKVNGRAFAVVGVTREGFTGTFPGFVIDVWVPLMMQAIVLPQEDMERLDSRFLMVMGRLKAGVSRQEALVEVKTLAEQLAAEHPDTNRGRSATLLDAKGIHPFIARFAGPFLALLMGMTVLVLLIACANVTNLLLARNTNRAAEMAVRASLGATRFRLLWQLLAENLLLSGLGGALGLLLAVWGMYALENFRLPTSVPIGFALRMDWSVLMFTFVVVMLAGMIFGLLPAWHASRPNVMHALRGELVFNAPRRWLLRNALVVAQVAVCLMLLAGAGLLGRSLLKVGAADPGFDARNMLAVRFEPHHIAYSAERARIFYQALRAELETQPGVRAVTYALAVPLSDRAPGAHLYIAGKTAPAGRDSPTVFHNLVAPDYFEVMGIPLLQGRGFTEHDRQGAAQVAVVSQAFAGRYWPGENPLGKQIQLANRSIWGQVEPPIEVVGVVRDIKYRSWSASPEAVFFLPLAQQERSDITLHIRTAGDPRLLIEPVRSIVRRLDAELPVASARPMREMMAFTLIPARIAGSILGICGSIALLLAAAGIFGVVAFSVSRRTREFGIRMALGAQRRDVLRLVMGKGMLLVAVGTAIGLAASAGLGQLIQNLLYGVSPFDLVTLCAVSALLAGVALLACYLPARHAVRVDPSVALRYE
jgi:putative ABC transport system permease protein